MSRGLVADRWSQGAKPMRVLIADSDQSLLAKYQEHSSDDVEVLTALSGLECVDQLRQQAPDVLVLEPQLPWGGGDGVLAMMHDHLNLANVPVLLLTSCCDPSVLKAVARFPISDFHPKPLSPEQLVGRIRRLLKHPK